MNESNTNIIHRKLCCNANPALININKLYFFFSKYKTSPEKHKEFYLLSVFLGDFIQSPKFCNQLAKRGRACKDEQSAKH